MPKSAAALEKRFRQEKELLVPVSEFRSIFSGGRPRAQPFSPAARAALIYKEVLKRRTPVPELMQLMKERGVAPEVISILKEVEARDQDAWHRIRLSYGPKSLRLVDDAMRKVTPAEVQAAFITNEELAALSSRAPALGRLSQTEQTILTAYFSFRPHERTLPNITRSTMLSPWTIKNNIKSLRAKLKLRLDVAYKEFLPFTIPAGPKAGQTALLTQHEAKVLNQYQQLEQKGSVTGPRLAQDAKLTLAAAYAAVKGLRNKTGLELHFKIPVRIGEKQLLLTPEMAKLARKYELLKSRATLTIPTLANLLKKRKHAVYVDLIKLNKQSGGLFPIPFRGKAVDIHTQLSTAFSTFLEQLNKKRLIELQPSEFEQFKKENVTAYNKWKDFSPRLARVLEAYFSIVPTARDIDAVAKQLRIGRETVRSDLAGISAKLGLPLGAGVVGRIAKPFSIGVKVVYLTDKERALYDAYQRLAKVGELTGGALAKETRRSRGAIDRGLARLRRKTDQPLPLSLEAKAVIGGEEIKVRLSKPQYDTLRTWQSLCARFGEATLQDIALTLHKDPGTIRESLREIEKRIGRPLPLTLGRSYLAEEEKRKKREEEAEWERYGEG